MPMPLLADLEEFVADHRPHGTLTGDATAPAWNGYRLPVACTASSSSGGSRRRTPSETLRGEANRLREAERLLASAKDLRGSRAAGQQCLVIPASV
jgi:hypothetical protein